MDVAAERDVGGGRHDAARRIQPILDIAPSRRVAGFGMNVEAIILLQRKRQFRQKTPLCRAEPPARHSIAACASAFIDSVVVPTALSWLPRTAMAPLSTRPITTSTVHSGSAP